MSTLSICTVECWASVTRTAACSRSSSIVHPELRGKLTDTGAASLLPRNHAVSSGDRPYSAT